MLLSQQLTVSLISPAEDNYVSHYQDYVNRGVQVVTCMGSSEIAREVSSVELSERSVQESRLALMSPCSHDRGAERLVDTFCTSAESALIVSVKQMP